MHNTQSLAFDEAASAALEEAREAQSLEVRQAREAVDKLSQDVAGVWLWKWEVGGNAMYALYCGCGSARCGSATSQGGCGSTVSRRGRFVGVEVGCGDY
mgnify:CR=1 FL=1